MVAAAQDLVWDHEDESSKSAADESDELPHSQHLPLLEGLDDHEKEVAHGSKS